VAVAGIDKIEQRSLQSMEVGNRTDVVAGKCATCSERCSLLWVNRDNHIATIYIETEVDMIDRAT
jgi:hypothetical protein